MGSWAGWLLTAAMLHLAAMRFWARTNFLPHHRKNRCRWTFGCCPCPSRRSSRLRRPPLWRTLLEAAQLQASFAWQAPRRAEKSPPRSASAVAHAARPVAGGGGMTGAERGTAIHAFYAECAL